MILTVIPHTYYTLMIWTEEEIGLIHCVVPDALDLSHDA